VFDGSGKFLYTFGSWPSFDFPTGIAVDGTGRIYIADTLHDRIQVYFGLQSAAALPEPHTFIGFYPPVYNPPAVNVAQAGSAVPVKFSVTGYSGVDILEAGHPTSQQIACDSLNPLGTEAETFSAGARGLIYDASTGQYSYTWKTDRAWAGSCRQLIVKLNDGTWHMAYFTFK
jgi:hypothetical protein